MSFGISGAAIAGIAAGAASLGSAAMNASASRKAARAQGDAAAQQAQVQFDIYQQQRQDQSPWRTVGTNALNELATRLGLGNTSSLYNAQLVDTSSGFPMPNQALYQSNEAYRNAWNRAEQRNRDNFNGQGFNEYSPAAVIEDQLRAELGPEIARSQTDQTTNPLYGSLLRNFTAQDFETDPGYQFRLGEGQRQIESSAAARGGLLSGAAAKALTKYNQNFASNEYNNAYNRFNTNQTNTYNRLAGIAGVGQQATNQLQQAGTNYATGASNALQQQGAARASGYAGQANALGYGLGGLSGAISNIPFGSQGGSSTYTGSPYTTYQAQTSPVVDYYAGTQPQVLA